MQKDCFLYLLCNEPYLCLHAYLINYVYAWHAEILGVAEMQARETG